MGRGDSEDLMQPAPRRPHRATDRAILLKLKRLRPAMIWPAAPGAPIGGRLLDILQTELLGFLVITEQFRIPPPPDYRPQGGRCVIRRHVVFQFIPEPNRRSPVVPPLVQYLADHVHQRYMLPQRFGEHALPPLDVGIDKT